MPKEACIKNQSVQGGNSLDFVEEIGGGILTLYIYIDTWILHYKSMYIFSIWWLYCDSITAL